MEAPVDKDNKWKYLPDQLQLQTTCTHGGRYIHYSGETHPHSTNHHTCTLSISPLQISGKTFFVVNCFFFRPKKTSDKTVFYYVTASNKSRMGRVHDKTSQAYNSCGGRCCRIDQLLFHQHWVPPQTTQREEETGLIKLTANNYWNVANQKATRNHSNAGDYHIMGTQCSLLHTQIRRQSTIYVHVPIVHSSENAVYICVFLWWYAAGMHVTIMVQTSWEAQNSLHKVVAPQFSREKFPNEILIFLPKVSFFPPKFSIFLAKLWIFLPKCEISPVSYPKPVEIKNQTLIHAHCCK